MRYLALACDYDGTLASAGKVSNETLSALERLKKSGRKLILVSGRELPDLLRRFHAARCLTLWLKVRRSDFAGFPSRAMRSRKSLDLSIR